MILLVEEKTKKLINEQVAEIRKQGNQVRVIQGISKYYIMVKYEQGTFDGTRENT